MKHKKWLSNIKAPKTQPRCHLTTNNFLTKSPTNLKMFNPLWIVVQSHQKVGIHFITNVVIVLVFLSCVHICLDMPCTFWGWIFILVYIQGLWILGHRLGFYWVSKILVEKQFMNVKYSILMKKLRSPTCCEKCYTFWTLYWKLKNQILLCFIAQDKQFVSLQKNLDEMCKQN